MVDSAVYVQALCNTLVCHVSTSVRNSTLNIVGPKMLSESYSGFFYYYYLPDFISFKGNFVSGNCKYTNPHPFYICRLLQIPSSCLHGC